MHRDFSSPSRALGQWLEGDGESPSNAPWLMASCFVAQLERWRGPDSARPCSVALLPGLKRNLSAPCTGSRPFSQI